MGRGRGYVGKGTSTADSALFFKILNHKSEFIYYLQILSN